MAGKKTTLKDFSPKKRGFVTYHGIKIASGQGKRSAASKLIQEELHQQSESRGERKSA